MGGLQLCKLLLVAGHWQRNKTAASSGNEFNLLSQLLTTAEQDKWYIVFGDGFTGHVWQHLSHILYILHVYTPSITISYLPAEQDTHNL